jgi:AcrR family transcriptional regulator
MARRRSASAHQKVLDAAIELVAEHGVDGTSMDAVASASGVSKATIYKHWANKDALLLEIMAEVNCLGIRPSFDTGDIRADINAVLCYRPQEHADVRERIMPHFMAYASRNPEIGHAWRNMVMDPPRRELKYLLELGIAHGVFPAKLDINLSLALLLGPILYWYVFLRQSDDSPKAVANGVVDEFFRAFAIRKQTKTIRAHHKGRAGRPAQARAPAPRGPTSA